MNLFNIWFCTVAKTVLLIWGYLDDALSMKGRTHFWWKGARTFDERAHALSIKVRVFFLLKDWIRSGEEESQDIMEVLEVLGEVATWRLGRDGYVGEDWREVKMLTIWSELQITTSQPFSTGSISVTSGTESSNWNILCALSPTCSRIRCSY